MKSELEELAFKYLEPEVLVAHLTRSPGRGREGTYIEKVKKIIETSSATS
jgi:hypothetical protein